jgi:hypothetical protein
VDRSDWLAPEGEFTAPLTIFSLLHEQDSKADSSFLPTIVMTTVQHSEDFCCAFCYAPAKKLLVCGRCLKRRYCSKDCQSSDWKEASHKYFCGKAGEIGIDYDIRPTEDGRGLGVFTRRSFEKNDIIMAERPIIKANDDVFHKNGWDQIGWDQIPSSVRPAIRALLPIDGTIKQKIQTNGMACTLLFPLNKYIQCSDVAAFVHR